ncbi:hypothetical protein C0Q70_05438 [Pomacea canaliculata]|uniref:PH domain-containing protein n=1 Tax=Pomacea canaliculata TaxID=400727 RepID=A0A2T7PL68_POMCA|nr:hypothetical protein C0Q70_05438 [Pomacea canaliculata]
MPNTGDTASPGRELLDREKYEIKSGQLCLLHRMGEKSYWVPVYVRVYRSCFEHFAVVSKDQAVTTNATYVNLRSASSSIVPGDCLSQFRVVQNNFEGTVITFDVRGHDSIEEWVDAFQSFTPPSSPTLAGVSPSLSPVIPRSPVLPPLPEIDEQE